MDSMGVKSIFLHFFSNYSLDWGYLYFVRFGRKVFFFYDHLLGEKFLACVRQIGFKVTKQKLKIIKEHFQCRLNFFVHVSDGSK